MYAITYQTKQDGSGVFTTNDYPKLKKKVVSLFKQHLTATVYKDGKEIGKVFQDDSQRNNWNYIIEEL